MSQTILRRTDEKTQKNCKQNLKTLTLLWLLPLLYLAPVCLGDQFAAPPGAPPQGATVTFNDPTVPFASGSDTPEARRTQTLQLREFIDYAEFGGLTLGKVED